MTNIELETMTAIKTACRKFIDNSQDIDWEERRFELVKETLPYMYSKLSEMLTNEEIADASIKLTDIVIEKLRKKV